MRGIILFVILAISLRSVQAQSLVTGKVLAGDSKEGLPGATIYIKGTSTGTVTDYDGNFSINASKGDVLTISFIGYEKTEVTVNSDVINLVLDPNLESLEEVVVIGYGSVKKSDITGSVASVRAEDLNPGPVVSVSGYLQNTAPGVVLTQSSSQPGGGFNIKVRGTTSILGGNGPLYVIDGLPITSDNIEAGSVSRNRSSPNKNPLNGINPEDIASIEVLKDASATAIYGARGANGVILITTKRGKKGTPKINYSGSYSIQEVANEYDMLNGTEFARVSNEEFIRANPTSNAPFSPAQVNSFGEGTDWLDAISRVGTINRHQVALSGASNKYNYYVSGNYFEHKGVINESALRRYSSRINFTYDFNKRLKMGTNLILSQINDKQVPFGSDDGGGPEFAGLFDNTRTWSPLVPVRNEEGNFSRHPNVSNIPNPVSLLDIDDQIDTRRLLGSFFTEYELTKGLKAKVNLGYDRSVSERESLIPLTVVSGMQTNGEQEFASNRGNNLLGEITLNYEREIGDNYFSALGGYTYQRFNNESQNTLLNNVLVPEEAIDTVADFPTRNLSRLLSYLGRFNYNIKNKYLLTFSIRADGSTKFGANNKWGIFPSAAFAWKIHEESFFRSRKIEEFKFRASYGTIGNQEIGNLRSQAILIESRRTVIGNQPIRGIAPLRPENQSLQWESTTQLNFGLDFTMFKGRIQSTFDVYQKVTSGVLLQSPLEAETGFTAKFENAGVIANNGVEFSISSVNLNGKLGWETSFNVAYNRNRWRERATFFPTSRTVEGETDVVGGTYGYVVEGIFRTQEEIDASLQPEALLGTFKFKDTNGDNDITPDDRVLLGKEDPDVTLGLSNILRYKNFELNFFFQAMLGREKHNYTRAALENVANIGNGYNKSVAVLDRWTPNNINGTVHSGQPLLAGGDNSLNSVYVEDASFIRLRNVTLGYNFKSIWFMESVRLYADAQNVLTITDFQGLDPETSEFLQYPNAKTYSIGLNVNF